MGMGAAAAWRMEVPVEPFVARPSPAKPFLAKNRAEPSPAKNRAEPSLAKPLAEPSDDEIVQEVLLGAPERFALLVRRYRATLRRAVGAVVRDRADIEDVLQQALLHAFASLRGWSGTAPFSVWLRRIALNEALMRVRSSRRLQRAALQLARVTPGVRDSPEEQVATREDLARVGAAFPRLPARHREILQLATIRELPRPDVAQRLGVSEGAVKVRLHRARQALRGLLEDGDGLAGARGPRVVVAPGPSLVIPTGGREEPGLR